MEHGADNRAVDVEKDAASHAGRPSSPTTSVGSSLYSSRWRKLLQREFVEARGIAPVPVEKRTDTRYSQIFFIWFSWNFNILTFSAGTLGPLFGLGLRDSCLVILFFNLLCAAPPAYLATWGPKTGLRQMCQARFSFGYYGVILPSVLNLIGMCGFSVLNCILGGQTLAAVSGGSLSWTVGIVIIAVISLLLSFCGLKAVTWYERLAWLPVLITFVIALGVGGKHLADPPLAEPATAQAVLSFGSVIAGFVVTYSPLSSDYTTYFHHEAPSWKIFLYSYIGFLLPIVPLMCLGAAAALSAIPELNPSWAEGYESGSVGGLLLAMLGPTHGFGKFLTVLLCLSVTGNVAPTFYSFGLSFQVFVPWLVGIPRYFFSLLATAIVLPLAIVGSHRFYETLTDFLSVIGYWVSSFVAVILLEHLLFRHKSFSPAVAPSSSPTFARGERGYDLSAWNAPGRLPPGVAAVTAAVLSFGLVVPSMAQAWWTGPIGAKTGDIGFEVAFVLTGILYVPLRWLERRLFGR